MRNVVLAAVAILLTVFLVACSAGSGSPAQGNDQPTASSAQDTDPNGEAPAPAGENAQEDAPVTPANSGGVPIILNMNGTDIHATLYDNTAAHAFLDLLPYTVTVSRAADDLCGTVPEQLSHDAAEDQDTWAVGEIGWFDGWVTILCANEEGMPKRTRTILGKVEQEDIPAMQALTGRVEITVTLDTGRG